MALEHGLTLTEYDSLRPWETRELLQRLDKAKADRTEAEMKLQADYVNALIGSIGTVIKALDGVAKRVDNLTKLVAKKPSL